ncbi:unnamed protein product [Penicillium palitans]
MENIDVSNSDLQDFPGSFFLGFARVQIRSFEFGINDEENVLNYLQFFECNGCSRLDPEHHVSAVANQDVFTDAIESQNLSAAAFYDVKNPPVLQLEPGKRLRCIRGHDLLEAAHRYLPPGERWWYTKLYRDEDNIRQNYSISEPASDEIIFRSILLRDSSLERAEANFGSSADYHYVKQVNQNPALRSALKRLARYRGLWRTFTYRKLEYIVSPRCDEEIVHYLTQIYEIWSRLFPGENASLVDALSVELVEGRMPKYSLDDRSTIEDGMRNGLLFPGLESNRDGVLEVQPQQSPGEFHLTSMVSLPPHPEMDSYEWQQDVLLAPGFEEHDSMAPMAKKNKILRLADAKDILSDWFQAIPNRGAIVVLYLFQTHEYIKFHKQAHDIIRSYLDDLVTGRQYYLLALNDDILITVEIEHATDVAIDCGLLFVGNNEAFFPGDKSKDLTRGISQTQLDEHFQL